MPAGNAISRLVLLALVSLASISTLAAPNFGPKFKLRINYQDGAGPYENHHLLPPTTCTDRNGQIFCIFVNTGNNPKNDGHFQLYYNSLKTKIIYDTGEAFYISTYEILDNWTQYLYRGAGPVNGTLAFTPGTKRLYSHVPGFGERSWTLCPGYFARKNVVVSHGTAEGVFSGNGPCDRITLTRVPV